MLSTRNSWLLRPLAQVVIWVLLLAVMFGPRKPVIVCTGESCCAVVHDPSPGMAADEPECSCCGCCAHAHPAAKLVASDGNVEVAPGSRPASQRGRTCVDCCVDVSLPIDLTLVPRTVEAPAGGSTCIGVASVTFLPAVAPPGDPLWPFDTGPPRPDPRTSLLATTILRQ